MDITNKVVWVIGASSGIGEATVKELSNKNCKIVLSARRKNELERVAKNLDIPSESILILPIDLEFSEKAGDWTKKIIEKFGRIDILINNGGISQKSFAMDTSTATEKKIMDINYFGNVAIAKSVIPIMQKQQEGKIVVITSIVGKFGLPELSTYAASKHALYGFYESLRLEVLKDKIDVLLVSPGFINTNVAINAIKGDGTLVKENSDAQENGMKPSKFAKTLVKAIQSHKNHIYIGNKELLSIPFKTFLPNLFYSIMLKMSNNKK